MRTQFHERLERTEHDLMALGELAATAVQRGVRAFVDRDDTVASQVIADDDAIDERYLALDHGTLSLVALRTNELPAAPLMLAQIADMGDQVVQMLRIALEAFTQRDAERAEQLQKLDDPVDRLNRATHLEALKLADDPRALDWGMHANLAARALERVGDQAVDIGEQVAYLVTGEFREFTDASHKVDPHKIES
jgi:phosphate transport system protein